LQIHIYSVNVAHHLHKLFEIYFSVPVLIYFLNGFLELLVGVDTLKVVACEEFVQLIRIDLAAAVGVEHVEGCLESVFLQVRLLVHGSCQEF